MMTTVLLNVIVLVAAASVSGAPSQVREVPFPYRTIQEAIDAANDGDTIVLHPGTYVGEGNRDVDFSGKAITVRSEDPDEEGIVAATIIDCEGTAEDPHRAFIFQNFEDANSILDGFTILNGYVSVGADAPDPSGNGADGEDSMGGAINCTGASPIIRNCIINNCVAEGGVGGAGAPGEPGVPADSGDPNDPNDDIPSIPPTEGGAGGDGGNGYGGAIYCDPNSGPTILNCEFNVCSAIGGTGGAGGAGGIAGDPNDPNAPAGEAGVSDANAWGGGICVASGSTASVTDCIFYDCNAIGGDDKGRGGGVFYGMGYSGALVADVTACVSGFGGGVYCDANCVLAIAGCLITEGAADYGANIYSDVNCVLEISDCNLINGTADYGAGLCCAPMSTVNIHGTKILNNIATSDGGGIFFGPDGILTLNGCNIGENTATGSGGGIFYDTGGTLTLENCGVVGNSSGDGIGGGIFAGDLTVDLGATVVISSSTISDNTALYGAGMCLVGTISAIDDCTIGGNMAEYGGGAYWYLSDVNISNCTVSNNIAATRTYCSGGGLYCLDSTARIEDCVVTGNEAQGFGGAVYLIGPNLPGGVQELTNCLITDNAAGLDGAGLSFNVDATAKMANCTVTNNHVADPDGGGGGVSCYDAFVEIVNSILWNNAAGNGPEIAIGDPLEPNNPLAVVALTYSDVDGGEEYVYIGAGCTLNWGEGNIDGNPLFADGYHLSQTEAGDAADSPCVDTGSESAEALGLHRYTTRTDIVPDTNIVDMGYHYRLPTVLCDLDTDGNVDLADLAILLSCWLEEHCELTEDCQGASMDSDTDVDFFDYAICAGAYAPVDEAPPTPDPSLWEIEPRTYLQLPDSVVMKAVTASDASGVKYRFVCTDGGGHDSGWQDEPLYVDNGLSAGTYTYKCQARDKSPQKNMTAWSVEGSASIE